MPNFQDLPNLEGESILTYIFKSSLGIKLRVLKCFLFVGAFSPAQMRRTRKISCQKHLSWASLITQMWLRWKELLHKVSLQWFPGNSEWFGGALNIWGKAKKFLFLSFCVTFCAACPSGPPLCCTFRKMFFCYSLRRNPPGHWVILIFSGQ